MDGRVKPGHDELRINASRSSRGLVIWRMIGRMARPSEADLFGKSPAQASLFGPGEDRLQAPRQSSVPDPETVRLRLKSLLEKARSAEKMPWSERDARMWQTVFPNMAKWLPEEEGAQLRLEFEAEMERLKAA